MSSMSSSVHVLYKSNCEVCVRGLQWPDRNRRVSAFLLYSLLPFPLAQRTAKCPVVVAHPQSRDLAAEAKCKPPRVARVGQGLFRELNPGPLAPEARIIPLDQTATRYVFSMTPSQWRTTASKCETRAPAMYPRQGSNLHLLLVLEFAACSTKRGPAGGAYPLDHAGRHDSYGPVWGRQNPMARLRKDIGTSGCSPIPAPGATAMGGKLGTDYCI